MRTPMIPGPSTITLDQESFKALASEVRVDILKKLDERRQTVTDLSGLLNLSKPTLLEHLEKLQAAGLVKRVDEGRKWIYYELSQKGKKLLHPEKVAIILALSTTIALAAIGFVLLLATSYGGLLAPAVPTGNATMAGGRGPLNYDAFADPARLAGLVALASAAVAGVIAAGLAWVGRRRRERFFSEVAHT